MRITVASDFHIPHQDTELVNKWLSHIFKTKPDKIIINGDLADFATVSKYDKVPGLDASFQKEVELVKQFLSELRRISNAEIIYLTGNHEFRLRKYLISIAKEFYDMDIFDIESLFDLKHYNIKLIDLDEKYSSFQDNYIQEGKWLIGHFNLARGGLGATAKGLVEKYGMSIIQGHVHRVALISKWQYKKQIIGIEGGCMCKMDNNYRRNANWQRGWVDLVDGEAQLHAVY